MKKTQHTAFDQLPIVDISSLFSKDKSQRQIAAKQLDIAARDAGFLYIKGHSISQDLISDLKRVVKWYFAQDAKSKMEQYIGNSNNHTGYVPQGEEIFYSESPDEDNVDLKEAYDIGPESPSLMASFVDHASTQWPENNPHFKQIVSDYYQTMLRLSRILFEGFALALNLPEDTFSQYLTQPPSQLRLLHYFDNPNAKPDDSGIGAHTDYEFFTLLLPTSPGLQVLNGANQWINVPVIDDCFVLNIGDMMELTTNGYYVATSHRVRQVKEERYAFPFFASLDYHTVVAPLPRFVDDSVQPHYQPLICGDHLLSQTVQTFAYLQQREKAGEITLPESALPTTAFGQVAIQGH